MNNAVMTLLSVILFLGTSIMWFTSDETHSGPAELFGFVIVLVLAGFGLIAGIRQIISARKEELRPNPKELIFMGIPGMFITYATSWLVLNFKDLKTPEGKNEPCYT